ncbi:MAG: bifunctional hydroxymethylpyrimidine kinase/phosphomethylpyrimidine kinase [Nitrospinae bacterium CG22_combo_CG10-13_8_21_14_all_47_10]|nr:MAG: bifunctional hydroxymethylpyrimidine kinase/phosphomethylpyrimidine kinase [Nitrospinae bacterium CG22_combo_CG10-13_8_21_14_all_47_10]
MAGSDSGGGAGIQADLKTFSAFGVFGKTVITSVTSQNTLGVQAVDDLPVGVVESQLKSIFEDGKCQAVKTGMLGNEQIVDRIASLLKRYRVKNLVVDPVIFSSSGKRLLTAEGVEMMKERLLPLAHLVTPNIREAEILSGVKIRQLSDMKRAARKILKLGVRAVVLTGGHLKGKPEDLFLDNNGLQVLTSERLSESDPHGTGCVFSSAITAGLASGLQTLPAVQEAKAFIGRAILGEVISGNGKPSVDPLSSLYRESEKAQVMDGLNRALRLFRKERIGSLVPEVQTNIGLALKNAKNHEDVLAIPGRIVKNGDDIFTGAEPEFGGSRHVANIVLTVMRYDPGKRAVMNIKYTDTLLKICQRLRFRIASFDRADEPRNVRVREGSSLEWGTQKAIMDYGSVPDIIYDLGGIRKEEMIRVIAEDIESLTNKILKIHNLYQKTL